jgi:hypothetical protein
MATLNGIITGNVAGDDIDVTRSVTGVPATQTLALAWMTFKTNVTDADPGLLQKAITTASVAGTGQITDTGASGTGVGLLPAHRGEYADPAFRCERPLRHQGQDVSGENLHSGAGDI